MGILTPDFSASQAAWPTKAHSHPTAHFVHGLKRATSLGSQNPRLCRSPSLGNRLWPDRGVKCSVGWRPGACWGRGCSACVSGWPVATAPTRLLSPAQPPSAGEPRPLSQPVLSSSVPRLASPASSAGGFPALGTSAADAGGPRPAPAAGSRISTSAWSPPGQPLPHLPHTRASTPGVSFDRPHAPHRVTSKVLAVASQAGRGRVSPHTPIPPWSAPPPPPVPPHSRQCDRASVTTLSSLLSLFSKMFSNSSGPPTLPTGTRS